VSSAIDLSQNELAIVRAILHTHLPPGARAWIFGSRVNGKARRYSNIDIALEGEDALGMDILGHVAEALSESDLPYKVDIVDLQSVDAAFRALIETTMIAIKY
jgi:uncharacterized protein